MKPAKASRNAIPRPSPTPSPTLAPLESPPAECDAPSLSGAELVDDDGDDDDVGSVVEAVVEAGKSLAWKLSWNMGAYNIIVVRVDVDTLTSAPAEFVWVTVTILGNVSVAESVRSVPSQKAVGMDVDVAVAMHVFPLMLAHEKPLIRTQRVSQTSISYLLFPNSSCLPRNMIKSLAWGSTYVGQHPTAVSDDTSVNCVSHSGLCP